MLYETEDMKIGDVLDRCTKVYGYLKQRTIETNMTLEPQQIIVERHLDALGFYMENKGKKTCVVKSAQVNLAHYAF
jgi:hypothetical protein